MSLLITSSEQNGNGAGLVGDVNPANYTNHFRSPVIIPPMSSIAVESVKIERSGNISLKENNYFCHYFGADQNTANNPVDYDYFTDFSRTIPLRSGTYNLATYAHHIRTQMNSQYSSPEIWNGADCSVVTDSSGQEIGVKIQVTQKGSASGTSKITSLVDKPYFAVENPFLFEATGQIKPSDEYTWTAGAGTFARTGAVSTSITNTSAVGILTGIPLGLCQGKFNASVKGANAAPWAVGLSRPQVQGSRGNMLPEPDNQGFIGTSYMRTNGVQNHLGPYEHYDYVVWYDGTDIRVGHSLFVKFDEEDDDGEIMLQEIKYWESGGPWITARPMTLVEFNTSYDSVEFEGVGDGIKLSFKDKTNNDMILDPATTQENDACFKPIGGTTYALYPVINIGAGTITVNKYESKLSTGEYAYPSYNTAGTIFTPGDDLFSNEYYTALRLPADYSESAARSGGPLLNGLPEIIDSNDIYESPITSADDYTFVGLNASLGVDYEHILTVNPLAEDALKDYLAPAPQPYPNMGFKLGFDARSVLASTEGLAEGYSLGQGGLIVSFSSTSPIDRTSVSSFIRIPNLTQQSFNGATSSISKILYQVPQFSNEGRQFGPLYFSASEKTYISLRNPAEIMLNKLDVQIVDVNEREIDALTGTTQVVFHIKDKCE